MATIEQYRNACAAKGIDPPELFEMAVLAAAHTANPDECRKLIRLRQSAEGAYFDWLLEQVDRMDHPLSNALVKL